MDKIDTHEPPRKLKKFKKEENEEKNSKNEEIMQENKDDKKVQTLVQQPKQQTAARHFDIARGKGKG